MIFDTPLDNQFMDAANDASMEYLEPAPKLPLRQFNSEAQQRAADFILEFGTNLQRERLLYHFPVNPAQNTNANVLAALSHYQNDDGGFGHGLEADLRSKKSTVIATTVGLQILDRVGALDTDLALNAIQYLSAQYQDSQWQAIHPEANDAPHAPWWRYESIRDGFQANPSVEVLKYLLSARAMAKDTPVLLANAIDYIMTQPLDMHELLCYMRLYECSALGREERIALLPYLLSNGYRLVNVEPLGWEEYCLTPLCVATHPGSVFAEFFADVLPDNFQFLIDSQESDGSWSPNWSWAGEFPATWKVVKTEIKAEITLKNLLLFQAYQGFEG